MTMVGMAQNFLACDREQAFLMPPSLRDWLPEDHLAWFVLAAVEGMDLSAFYGAYRVDGHGRAAFEAHPVASASAGRRPATACAPSENARAGNGRAPELAG